MCPTLPNEMSIRMAYPQFTRPFIFKHSTHLLTNIILTLTHLHSFAFICNHAAGIVEHNFASDSNQIILPKHRHSPDLQVRHCFKFDKGGVSSTPWNGHRDSGHQSTNPSPPPPPPPPPPGLERTGVVRSSPSIKPTPHSGTKRPRRDQSWALQKTEWLSMLLYERLRQNDVPPGP